MKKYIGIAIVAVVVLGTLVWVKQKEPARRDVIRIGAPLSLTGTAAADSENIKRGLDLAQADLRERGIEVEIIYDDDGTDPKRTVSVLQKMLMGDKPDALVGPTWSFPAEAGSPIIDQAGIVSYQPANTSEFVATDSSYMFFGANKNAGKEKPVTAWLKDNGKKRVAMILDSSSWGESHLAPFKNAVEAVGGEIVLTERIPFGAEVDTIPTVLAKIVGAKADVILTTGYEDGLTVFMQKVQQLGIDMPVIMASDIPPTLVKRGVVSLKPEDEFYIVTVRPAEEFAKKFEAKYGEAPGNYADRAYDGLMLIVEGLQKKGADESLADYLHEKTNYNGFATTYDFDDRGDIVGGEWVVEKLK